MKFNNNILKTLLQALGGGLLGYGTSQLENEYLYKDPKIQDISRIVGTGTGSIAVPLALSKNPKARALGLAALLSFAGPKQMGLLATDSAKGYFDAVRERELNEKDIRNAILETAKSNLETAKAQERSTKGLEQTLKSLFPIAAGLAGIGTALYAYNSFKKSPENNLKVKINAPKTPSRQKDSLYLEIPSEKISNKFYNNLGREILFKDENELLRQLEKDKKDKKNIKKASLTENSKLKFSDFIKSDSNLNSIYNSQGREGLKDFIKKKYSKLSLEDQTLLLNNIESKNKNILAKILDFASPYLQQYNIIQTKPNSSFYRPINLYANR